ncbi:hypothetical protein ACP275_12G013200 [Erythranthe tilingii]
MEIDGADEFNSEGLSASPPGAAKSIILVGKTGNGKSATGNSIHGIKAFKSTFKITDVPSSCELQTTVTENGQTLAVIDTPGTSSFEEYGMSLDDYLGGSDCPDPLKETLRMCGNRRVLFNNKTTDESEKSEQLKQLHDLLNEVADQNGGKPYTYSVVDTNEGNQQTNKLDSKPHEISLMETNDANELDYGGMPDLPPSAAKSIVLVGKTGNGKSATGNSILGRKAFKSLFRTTVVTSTCDVQTTVMENGQTLAVIDTPGLFDYSSDPEFIHKEMLKCITMAKDGIHAILLTMSIRTRFSREEGDGVLVLQKFFGPGIMDYMIVVFTGGDQFEEYGMSLDDYLGGSDCPDPLKETLRMCGNRRVLFNNKTTDESEKSEQLKQLHDLLNEVADQNGGKPYTYSVVDTNEGNQQTNKPDSKPHETSLMEIDGGKEFNCGGVSASPPGAAKSIVLVGKTGNGKSATGNSILGRKAFKSMFRTTAVTSTCDVQTTVMENGQTLAVIDTPGLFDYASDPEFIHKERLKCIKMAKDGIHAILLTVSIRTRFSREEEDGVLMLKKFFGPEIVNYMIVVFTGGDQFEECGMSLDDYLGGSDCPDPLKETLKMCGNRRVLFNNKTKDEAEKSEQLKQLHDLLKMVAHNNGGKPYTRTVVDTNEGKPYKHDVVVGTTGEKRYPYDAVVGTIGGSTKISKPEEEEEGSAFHSSQYDTSAIYAYKGATNKPHARTVEVSSSKKEDDIFEPHVRKAYEGQLENARLQAEIDILRDQMEFKDQTHKLKMDIEKAKRKKDKNLESRDGPVTRIKSGLSHVMSKLLMPPPSTEN